MKKIVLLLLILTFFACEKEEVKKEGLARVEQINDQIEDRYFKANSILKLSDKYRSLKEMGKSDNYLMDVKKEAFLIKNSWYKSIVLLDLVERYIVNKKVEESNKILEEVFKSNDFDRSSS